MKHGLALLTVFTLSLLSYTARAQERLETPLEAFESESKEYAKMHHVPLAEARRRNAILDEFSDLGIARKIDAEYADRMAGKYISHNPVFEYVVRLTGNAPPTTE